MKCINESEVGVGSEVEINGHSTDKIESQPTNGYKSQKWSKKSAQNDTDLGCFLHRMTRGTLKH